MQFDDAARAAVSTAVRRRREQLGLSQEEAAARSGGLISTANLRVVEAAGRTSLRARSVLGVARAMGWPDDALARIAAGDDPARWRDSLVVGDRAAVAAPRADGIELATVEQLDALRSDISALRAELEAQRRTLRALAERIDALIDDGGGSGRLTK